MVEGLMLSANFAAEEFMDVDDAMPAECVNIFRMLCLTILEPTHAQFNRAMHITSGYRTMAENQAAHGQPNSEHMATADYCACDFYVEAEPTRPVFDWMRNNPTLPFHQLILEHGHDGSTIIHVSINNIKPGIRSVLEGATHNSEPYVAVDHVPFAIEPAMGVETSTL
jgi:hypothetical protein